MKEKLRVYEGRIIMNDINTIEDLYSMLDRYTEGVDWDTFYTKRDKPAPFLKYYKLPDKCVVNFIKEHNIRSACEFGCGEGRNAIYLAKNNIDTEAYDLSETAIENAKRSARESKAEKVVFKSGNIFALDLRNKKFELVIDSGIFHHLSPHRRLQYRDIVSSILAENGYFILLCFAAGEDGADEVGDYEFYKSKQTGVAFTEERLKIFWGEKFDFVELRKGENIVEPQMWESEYLYICVLKKK
ncbi:MAG: class I SAM-dependent methyltransferase [Lachnospiraceae bacterium]|nr:class I SAM-dependent methyltransferase [Lachnospiraceae bacterium]